MTNKQINARTRNKKKLQLMCTVIKKHIKKEIVEQIVYGKCNNKNQII